MTDLIERLRGENGTWVDYLPKATRDEAADEIERLTKENFKLRMLLNVCADDLADELEGRYAGMQDHPAMKMRYDRDMQPVVNARAALGKDG